MHKKNWMKKKVFLLEKNDFEKISNFFSQHFFDGTNGENGRFRTNIQKTLEIEQVFVPSQYLVGAGNHICRTPNALKTS